MSLLPPSTSALERRLSAALADAAALPTFPSLWHPALCPEAALPALAWSLRVDEWDDAWPVAVRRQVCADAIELHRRRGTRASIQRALKSVGLTDEQFGWTAHIAEGIAGLRHDGTATHDSARIYGADVSWAAYSVTLNRPVTIAQVESARRILKATAPARCNLFEFNYENTTWQHTGQHAYDGTITHGAI